MRHEPMGPVPLRAVGGVGAVKSTMETVPDWKYAPTKDELPPRCQTAKSTMQFFQPPASAAS